MYIVQPVTRIIKYLYNYHLEMPLLLGYYSIVHL